MTVIRREGRGRLSSIDQLPDEAEPDILWALEELRKREMPSSCAAWTKCARSRPTSSAAWARTVPTT